MPKTSRRDFLRWTLAGSGLLLTGAASVLPSVPARAMTRAAAPVQQTALFMGTMVSITVAGAPATQAHDAMDLAFAEGRRLEGLLTRHDGAAPLGVLNSQGSLRDVPPELRAVLQRAGGVSRLTGGAFDATVLPLVRLLESRSDPQGELVLSAGELRDALSLVDARAVHLDGSGLRLGKQGMGLTLDGIAKGHIVDAMSAVLLRAGCENHLINAGGDILARGHKAPGLAWRVAVEDPQKRGHYPQVLELYNQAIATSGGYEMTYDARGRHHHLLDPGTGKSPELGSMSVLAPTCMQADALATALAVLPAQESLPLADSLSGCACGLLRRDGRLQVSRRWPARAGRRRDPDRKKSRSLEGAGFFHDRGDAAGQTDRRMAGLAGRCGRTSPAACSRHPRQTGALPGRCAHGLRQLVEQAAAHAGEGGSPCRMAFAAAGGRRQTAGRVAARRCTRTAAGRRWRPRCRASRAAPCIRPR
ncbi:FAD:protein FMN transferase [uncultured Desulfovibrio sp.]|uniref:FAD:protein FMN transferase n=1 Tax=uncultured Desulfovibrio sp. TaxID=167968 RepID=UPI002624DFCB|nr:FAD:protein FMN transferase [uncultured Desulfovibrio sp.]